MATVGLVDSGPMGTEVVVEYGLPALFVAAFLAGSLVPFPSEAAMIALLASGADPATAVAVAATGNFLGAVTLFWLGRRLVAGKSVPFASRLGGKNPERVESGLRAARRWGAPVLLLSWVPILGDVLVLAAAMVGVRALPFAVFTATGKLLRFGGVAFLTLQVA